jgi:hypothetical protein
MRILLLFLILPLVLVGCTSKTKPLTPEEEALISRGAVAVLFGRSIDIVNVERREGDVIYTTYVRPDDGSIWKNKFRFEGSALIWGNADGRWRTHPQDEKLSFSVDRQNSTFTISLSYADGSGVSKQFILQ